MIIYNYNKINFGKKFETESEGRETFLYTERRNHDQAQKSYQQLLKIHCS